ncbi:MAG TPA: hypothetical protein VKP88_06540, partial [Candidatus Paceibacterota bacterium]|nr:hypothetical protein [Candidatus Paceibacterota bacterium]
MSVTQLLSKKGPFYHFSIDDVFESLLRVSDQNIPLFDETMFAVLKEAHVDFGCKVDLELFYEKEIDGVRRTLTEVRPIRDEILAAGNWLRFAPHAQSYQVAPYEQTPTELEMVFRKIYDEIDRFAGNDMYATWARLHYYSEMYELAELFHQKRVTALFTTDNPKGSHRMDEAVGEQLVTTGEAHANDLHFIRTHYRLENFANARLDERALHALFVDSLQTYGYVIFYTHEYE